MSNQEIRYLIKNQLEYLFFINPHKHANTINLFQKHKHIIIQETLFLDNKVKNVERIYCYINQIKTQKKCYCGNNLYLLEYKKGYAKYCSSKCSANSNKTHTLRKNTCLKNLGVDNPSKSKKIKQKKIDTCNFNHGVDHPMQSKKVRAKSVQTCLENFGCEHPFQNYEVFKKQQKSSYRYKDYITPSDTTLRVQGYEPFALDILLKSYDENDIITSVKFMPKIWYYTHDNKKHRYYPDIYIKSENKFIEVKSTRTMELHYTINLLKQKTCQNMNFKHEIWIIDNKGNILEIIT